MRDIPGSRQANDRLTAARLSTPSPTTGRPITRAELAAMVHAWVLDHRSVDRPVDDVYIGKLERGVHRWPNEHYRAALRSILGVATDADLGFHREDRTPARPPAGADLDPMDPTAEPWELIDALTRTSIDLRAITQMETAMNRCAELYPTGVPGVIGPRVHRQLNRIKDALAGPQPVAVRHRLTRLLGYACGLAANVANDAKNPALAGEYFDVAMYAAQEAVDLDLAAWALANRGIASYVAGNFDTAIALLEQAADHSNLSAPRRRAWILALHARSVAAGREPRSALLHLDDSRATLDRATEPAGGTDFFDEARFDGMRGSTLLWLGQLEAAASVLQEAIDRRLVTEVKGRALLTLDLAQCRLLQDEPDEAARLTAASLEMASGSVVQPIARKAIAMADSIRTATPALAEANDQLAHIEAKALEGPS